MLLLPPPFNITPLTIPTSCPAGGASSRTRHDHLSRVSSGHESTFSLDLSNRYIRTPASERGHELPESYMASGPNTPRSPGPASTTPAAEHKAPWHGTAESAGAGSAPSGLLMRRMGLATDEGVSWTLGKVAAANGADGAAEVYLRGGAEAEGLVLGKEFAVRSITAPERVQEPAAVLARPGKDNALPATGLEAGGEEALV